MTGNSWEMKVGKDRELQGKLKGMKGPRRGNEGEMKEEFIEGVVKRQRGKVGRLSRRVLKTYKRV